MELAEQYISKSAFKNMQAWFNEPKYREYKLEIEKLIKDKEWQLLEDAFYTQISFGTAGIRGTTGIGSSKVSKVTIGEATQALCEYIVELDETAATKGIVIGFDTRLTSNEFSRYAAEVCAGNGVKAYIFDSYRSTPELSFAIRHLGCAAGIVISASHNPPEDNGFKAYLADGGQVVAPHDSGIVAKARSVEKILFVDFDSAVNSGVISIVGNEVDDAYITKVATQSINSVRDISIVYSPLHGTGATNTLRVLESVGFRNIITVNEQMTPDGNFPTIETRKPNPEDKVANDLAVATMLANDADIAITNDPDADRFGIIVRQGDEAKYLSGNQALALAADYYLRSNNNDTKKAFVAKTIVTTDLFTAIAEDNKATVYGDLPIGFKYISQLIESKHDTDQEFLIAGEESFGLLAGSDGSRDKDGAVGALLLAEYAAELKQTNKTLYDRLLELYQNYGIYVERLEVILSPGASGFTRMQQIMQRLRTSPPKLLAHTQVTSVLDYESGVRRYVDGTEKSVQVKKTNAVVIEFDDPRRRLTVRPSGTEPKIKVYGQWYKAYEAGTPAAKQYAEIETLTESLSRELEGFALGI